MKNANLTRVLLAAGIGLASQGVFADEAAMALAKKSGCFGCHDIKKTIVGPAWSDVAARYRGDPAAHDKLVASVMTGSNGKWGTKVHMKAQQHVSKADVSKLVTFILSLAK